MDIKKIGLVVKIDDEAMQKADIFEKWLQDKGIEVVRKKSIPPSRKLAEKCTACAPSDLYCVIVLGGDGTFLSAVRWIGNQDIPILGVKFGAVGFLAEAQADSLFDVADAVIEGAYTTSPRMRLRVRVLRGSDEIACETVLNDVVINKGALARLANLQTYINDHYLTTFRADGLIIATPTGSTAYSLAAGGPVIHPAVPGILITPICPFTLTNRSLIVPDTTSIRISMGEKTEDVMLTVDGQLGLDIDERDTVIVEKHDCPVRLIKIPNQHYFDILKEKLRWSGGRL